MLAVTCLLLHNFYGFAHDLHKIGFDARAADKGSVDVGMRDEVSDVVGDDASTVEDAHSFGGLGSVHFLVELPDEVDHHACTLGCSCFASADGPDWLVGDHYVFDMLLGNICQAAVNLCANHFLGLPCFVLIQVFADTDNGTQSVSKGCLYFFIDQFVGFAKVCAAFRVTENDGGTQFADHLWCDLTGKGTFLLVVHILCAQFDARIWHSIHDLTYCTERDRRWTQNTHDLRIVAHKLSQRWQNFHCKTRSTFGTVVHLPVSRYDSGARCCHRSGPPLTLIIPDPVTPLLLGERALPETQARLRHRLRHGSSSRRPRLAQLPQLNPRRR